MPNRSPIASVERTEALLAGLRREFVVSMQARADSIGALVSALKQARAPAPVLARLVREAHTLRGSAGTFGFAEVGDAAADLERAARDASPASMVPLEAAFQTLRDTVRFTTTRLGG